MKDTPSGFGYKAKRKNIKVLVHTVNDISKAEALLKRGVYGIYTDTIEPLEYVEISDY